MSIERRLSDFEKKLILTPIRTYIEATYNVEVVRNDTLGMKPPYIIVGNHVTNWDPFFINCYVEEPICFVAAAPAFRNPIMKRVLEYAGAISKTKSRADSSTVRGLVRAKKANRVIGLFPEGNRTWNGRTEPLVYATAKLVQSLNVPIVVAKIRGGYLSHPRWATSVRKGKVTVSLERLFEGEDVKALSTDAVHEALTEALTLDDFAWQRETSMTYPGKNLAHHLERYLFACPHCEEVGKLHSHDDRLTCQACNYEVRYTVEGLFAQVNEPLHFARIDDWNAWQQQLLQRTASKSTHISEALRDDVTLLYETDDGQLTKQGKASMTCDGESIVLTLADRELRLALANIQNISIHKHHKIDFYYDGALYHVKFTNKRASVYMWYSYVNVMQNKIV